MNAQTSREEGVEESSCIRLLRGGVSLLLCQVVTAQSATEPLMEVQKHLYADDTTVSTAAL